MFPAKAGIQNLALRRIDRGASSSFDGRKVRVNGKGRGCPPHSQPSPPQGGEGLCFLRRVIASEAKQPRGLTRAYGAPPTPAAPVLSQEGEDLPIDDLPLLGEVARSAEGGLVFLLRAS